MERVMDHIQQFVEFYTELPSIYEMTPEEHVEHYWRQIDEGREKMRAWKAPGFCMIVPPPPTPRHILVYFSLPSSTTGRLAHRPFDLWGHFELENDGSLDLRKVKKQWGLDFVTAIRTQGDMYEFNDPYILTPMAVKVLSNHGFRGDDYHLNVTERPCPYTLGMRKLRQEAFRYLIPQLHFLGQSLVLSCPYIAQLYTEYRIQEKFFQSYHSADFAIRYIISTIVSNLGIFVLLTVYLYLFGGHALARVSRGIQELLRVA